MEYYGLRPSGPDTDLIAHEKDVRELIKMYPDKVKDLWGDLGVCPYDFEIWKTISYLGHDDLKDDAKDLGEMLVITEEKLLVMKSFAMKQAKYLKDVELIVDDMLKRQSRRYAGISAQNKELLSGIKKITYLEKVGPGDK